MSRIDSNLLNTGGLAARLSGRKLPNAKEWHFAQSEISPQIEPYNKTITSQSNDAKRAQSEAPENFKIPKVQAAPPMRLLKPTKIDFKV